MRFLELLEKNSFLGNVFSGLPTYIAEVTTFASLIDACAKAGDLERAEKWMKDRALDEMASVSSRNDHLPRRVAL